ncbi:MAG: hypothetical protein M3304_04085 [Actinomycetota bacterium]|nr:hypothetical protein [Actinomycetota bacterium]
MADEKTPDGAAALAPVLVLGIVALRNRADAQRLRASVRSLSALYIERGRELEELRAHLRDIERRRDCHEPLPRAAA